MSWLNTDNLVITEHIMSHACAAIFEITVIVILAQIYLGHYYFDDSTVNEIKESMEWLF